MEAHDIKAEVKRFKWVGGILLVMTVVTVLVSYLKVSMAVAIVIALVIATFKGSLVASYFMHLIAEKKIVYALLISAVLLFFVMIGLFLWSQYNLFEGAEYVY